MVDRVPFRLKLTGDTADEHQFQGYDGYMALAGFAWTLSLVANYTDTGKIRQRGEFEGRNAVRAYAPEEGSVLVDFVVNLYSDPGSVFGIAAAGVSSAALLNALVRRVINRNVGEDTAAEDEVLAPMLVRRSGDIEALVAINEPPIRQAHAIIGNGADNMEILGGFNIINSFNESTKEYVNLNVVNDSVTTRDVSVSAFNANSGYGSVFDGELGRVVPFSMTRETLRRVKGVFSWGLDQYVKGTGARIRLTYTKILAMDGRPKMLCCSWSRARLV